MRGEMTHIKLNQLLVKTFGRTPLKVLRANVCIAVRRIEEFVSQLRFFY